MPSLLSLGSRQQQRMGGTLSLLRELAGFGQVAAGALYRLLIVLTVAQVSARAQTPTTPASDSLSSSILGTVRDSLGFPVPGASILITPSGSILRTDSAGRFVARRVPAGALTVSIRKLGFSPLQVQLALLVGQQVARDFVIQRLPQVLAEVEVKADRECARFSLEGILCRRESGMGFFMGRQEILEKGSAYPDHARLVLRDAPGFRRNLQGNPNTVQSIVGWRCIKWIYDGGFPYSYNPVVKVDELYAVEVYQPPDIPPEYQHWYWAERNNRSRSSRPCTLVVLWTMAEYQRSVKRMAREKQ